MAWRIICAIILWMVERSTIRHLPWALVALPLEITSTSTYRGGNMIAVILYQKSTKEHMTKVGRSLRRRLER